MILCRDALQYLCEALIVKSKRHSVVIVAVRDSLRRMARQSHIESASAAKDLGYSKSGQPKGNIMRLNRLLYAFSLMCFCSSLALSEDKCCICGPGCKCPVGSCPDKCAVQVSVKTVGSQDVITAIVNGKTREWRTQLNERASKELCQSLVKSAMCDDKKCPLKMPNVSLNIVKAK